MNKEKEDGEKKQPARPPIASSSMPALQFLATFFPEPADRRELYEAAMQHAYDHLVRLGKVRTALSVLFRLYDASVRESIAVMRLKSRMQRPLEVKAEPQGPLGARSNLSSISDEELEKLVFHEES